MSKIEYCPDCDDVLLPGNDHCTCGWKRVKNGRNNRDSPDNSRKGLCEWVGNGRKCPAVGSRSTNTKGAGPYYCSRHFGGVTRNTGIAIIDDYEKNGLPDRTPAVVRKMNEKSLNGFSLESGAEKKAKEFLENFYKPMQKKERKTILDKTEKQEIFDEKIALFEEEGYDQIQAQKMALELVLDSIE